MAFYKTQVTYNVVTCNEAFNGGPEMLAAQVNDGSAYAYMVNRRVEEMDQHEVMQLLAERNGEGEER